MKKIILAMFLISLGAISVNAALPQTRIIVPLPTCTPASPTPRSTATFSVTTTISPIDGVYLVYHECNPSICRLEHNVTMTLKGSTYQCTVTFTEADTTYVEAHAVIKSGTTWIKSLNNTIYFSTNNNNNSNNTNGTGKKSPGFEVVPVIAAIAVALILIRRKRS